MKWIGDADWYQHGVVGEDLVPHSTKQDGEFRRGNP
jgi:hypothetical protein